MQFMLDFSQEAIDLINKVAEQKQISQGDVVARGIGLYSKFVEAQLNGHQFGVFDADGQLLDLVQEQS